MISTSGREYIQMIYDQVVCLASIKHLKLMSQLTLFVTGLSFGFRKCCNGHFFHAD